MRAALLLLLLVTLITIKTVAGGKNKKERNKPFLSGSECTDWRYGNCVASNGDCGPGIREGSCDMETMRIKCRVPCNWKKTFGADCKYRFDNWGECDSATGLQIRSGKLKKSLFGVQCEPTITVNKPCPGKTKTKSKGKKRQGKGTRHEQ